MKRIDFSESEELRKKRNVELIRRMRDGEALKSFDSQASWFPPRPVIEKDSSAIDELYGKGTTSKGGNLKERRAVPRDNDSAQVVSLRPSHLKSV